MSRSPRLSSSESLERKTRLAEPAMVAAISRAASILRSVMKAGFCWMACPSSSALARHAKPQRHGVTPIRLGQSQARPCAVNLGLRSLQGGVISRRGW